MRAIEPEYYMDRVKRDIKILGQTMEDLMERFKYFMQGLQAKPLVFEAMSVSNFFVAFAHLMIIQKKFVP